MIKVSNNCENQLDQELSQNSSNQNQETTSIPDSSNSANANNYDSIKSTTEGLKSEIFITY